MNTPHLLRRVPTAVLALALLVTVLGLALLLSTSTSATATSTPRSAENAQVGTATTTVLGEDDVAFLADLIGPGASYTRADADAWILEAHVACRTWAVVPLLDRAPVITDLTTRLQVTPAEAGKLLDVAGGTYCPGVIPLPALAG